MTVDVNDVDEAGTEAADPGPDVASGGAKTQPPRRRRARAGATRAREAGGYLLGVLRALWARRGKLTDAERAAPSIRRGSVWRASLPTIAELITATRAGLWAPGDWPKPVENVGKAYGWCVAIPLSLALYGTAYVVQHPGRLAGAALFVTLLAVSL